LVLFTDAAQQTSIDVAQTAEMGISQLNACMANSRVPGSAYVELAGVQLLPGFVESEIIADLNSLTNSPQAQIARNNTNADIVILLTNGNYSGYSGRAASLEPTNDLAYAIVQIGQATGPNYVFAHEAGHLYGCRHHNDNSGQFLYARGYVFTPNIFSGKCLTVMVGGDELGNRILHFSNPNVRVQNTATGRVDYYNARRVAETYSTVQSFRGSPFRPFTASISGTETGNECEQGNWEAAVTCGVGPYNFEWSVSYDGFNYFFGGNGEFFSYTLTCPVGLYSNLYLKLTATGADGQNSTAFLTVYVNGGGGPPYSANKQKFNTGSEIFRAEAKSYDIYPTPTNYSQAYIEFELINEAKVRVDVFNSQGQLVKSLVDNKLAKGKHRYTLNTSTMEKGTYFCRLVVGEFVSTKKLVIE
jgi:hypothetical protein